MKLLCIPKKLIKEKCNMKYKRSKILDAWNYNCEEYIQVRENKNLICLGILLKAKWYHGLE